MKNHQNRSGALFLLELLFTILFFSLAAAVCVSLFVRAHTLSRSASDLNTAVEVVGNVCETVDASQSREEAAGILKEFFGAEEQNDVLTARLNENGEAAGDTDAEYLLTVTLEEKDGMLSADAGMSRIDTGEEVYHGTTAVHIQNTRP